MKPEGKPKGVVDRIKRVWEKFDARMTERAGNNVGEKERQQLFENALKKYGAIVQNIDGKVSIVSGKEAEAAQLISELTGEGVAGKIDVAIGSKGIRGEFSLRDERYEEISRMAESLKVALGEV